MDNLQKPVMTRKQERARYRNARYLAIRDIASVLSDMERLGATEMGHLTFRESVKFHKATDLLRALVDKMRERDWQLAPESCPDSLIDAIDEIRKESRE
jgi:hypothetical protein